jgi:serine/threonine protein kinase
MDKDEATRIVGDILTALASAHARGIIHRDLKTQNVLIAPEGEVVVVDFGMSKIVTGAGTGTTGLTAHNMVFGTPEYMSPEQARGDELDARCDVYAAGVMLYELTTGKVPFTGATPLNVLTAHLTAAPTPPRERAPERNISKALEAVVLHAIAKDRKDRYSSAAGLKAALLRASRAPSDTDSIRPPPVAEEDIATRDTELAPSAAGAKPEAPTATGNLSFVAVAVVAAAIGVALGIWLSLRS